MAEKEDWRKKSLNDKFRLQDSFFLLCRLSMSPQTLSRKQCIKVPLEQGPGKGRLQPVCNVPFFTTGSLQLDNCVQGFVNEQGIIVQDGLHLRVALTCSRTSLGGLGSKAFPRRYLSASTVLKCTLHALFGFLSTNLHLAYMNRIHYLLRTKVP